MQSITAISDRDAMILQNAEAVLDNHASFSMTDDTGFFKGLTTSGLEAAVAATPAADQAQALDDILNSALDAPGSTSVAAVPPAAQITNDVKQTFQLAQTLDSYVSLLTAICVYQEHPAPYDITKPEEASAFTQAVAKWRNYVLTGGKVRKIASYLSPGVITADTIDQTTTTAEVHMDVLKGLFKAYSLSASTLLALDGLLTEAVKKLENLKVGLQTGSKSLDHFISYSYLKEIEGGGGLKQGRLLMLYIKVDPTSWKAAIGGKAKVANYNLHVNYYLLDVAILEPTLQNDVTAIEAAIQAATNQPKTALDKKLNMQAVTADPQSA